MEKKSLPGEDFLRVSGIGRVHTIQAAAIANTTTPAIRTAGDLGVDAIDPADEGVVSILELAGEPVGAVVGAAVNKEE